MPKCEHDKPGQRFINLLYCNSVDINILFYFFAVRTSSFELYCLRQRSREYIVIVVINLSPCKLDVSTIRLLTCLNLIMWMAP